MNETTLLKRRDPITPAPLEATMSSDDGKVMHQI